ncbi:PAS domain-containing sensor histidine kinase [Pontibacter virosus]|uniref:histidine kinase n=1 Tax=Pontibacter virosus TaxID=1765052 RepID=A0A2U1B383_9BACT|nr:PAS domain-containing sensor histidine kinase [Pontibacter virosus]PVY43144.1 two-component system sensor histidine kinase VicK [Pontibacter virosus]
MNEKSKNDILREHIRRTKKIAFSYDVESASFTYLNNAFNQVCKQTRESVLADPLIILEAVHPDDRDYLVGEYRELLRGVLKEDVEFRIRQPDGSTRWLLLDPQFITDKQGRKYVTGIVEDITLVKDNIETLQKYAAKKNAVLEILSHDLAGPLANIKALADVLSELTKHLEMEEVDKVIRIIRASSEQNILLIRDFVKQEFLESSKVDLFKRRLDLVVKVKEVMEQYKDGEHLIQKEIRFTSSSDKIFVWFDDIKLMQVINNLFSNAIKFTPDNGTISLDLSEQEKSVLITIRDNGIGIPRKYHAQLFKKFSPARREGLRGEPSTGLGMSIIKTIVEWHGGSIWFESEEGAGTTFYIELPKE